ncbi:lanthionine synthetase C family protein [Echinicola marina]|uniref:lanthionine synthetase C family protein n=1 Tax=Echinicola marina TaxID=2859768 RepID=UPI001CF6AAE4|nr:lanthionine synthetase C family protein [Echinicola marina]UCS92403.1 lanthionine synthetase C family protein [Echinicola marina]
MNKKNILINEIDYIYNLLNKDFHKNSNIGLMGGKSGIILFHINYYKLYGKTEHLEQCYNMLCEVLDYVEQEELDYSFANGIAGIGWLIEYISKNELMGLNSDILLEEFDEILFLELKKMCEIGNFDFLHGALGLGLYFLKRRENELTSNALSLIVQSLYFYSETNNEVVSWKNWQNRNRQEDEMYNLGIAHGIPAIIFILSNILDRGLEKDKVKKLLSGGTKFLLNNSLDHSHFGFYFPHSLPFDKYKDSSRLAWCYGDLSVGLSLWEVTKKSDFEYVKPFLLELFLFSSQRRDMKTNYINDGCLCHGTSGLAIIFNKLYNESGIKEFNDSSNFWINKTLDLRILDDSYSRYRFLESQLTKRWSYKPGVLDGLAGIGLTYISKLNPDQSCNSWTELILC